MFICGEESVCQLFPLKNLMFKDFQNCSTKCEQFKKVINPGVF